MMQTKTFEVNYASSIDEHVNKWLYENKGVEITNVHINSTTRVDYYQGQEPTVCNVWGEIIVMIFNRTK